MKVANLKFALLLLASTACLVTSSLSTLSTEDMSTAKALISKTARTVVETQTLQVERVLSTLSPARGRNLQLEGLDIGGLLGNQSGLGDLVNALNESGCLEKIEALNLTAIFTGTAPSPDTIKGIITCVVQSVLNQFDVCLGNFPGFWNPVQCTINTTLDSALSDLDSSSTDSENMDNSTSDQSDNPLDLIGNITNLSLDGELDLQECLDTFGSKAIGLKPLSCMFGFKLDDIKGFLAAASSNFSDYPECASVQSLVELGVNGANLTDNSTSLEDSEAAADSVTQVQVDEVIVPAQQKLFQCDEEFTLGIEDTLEGNFDFDIDNENNPPENGENSAVSAFTNSFNLLLGIVVFMLMSFI